jgi:hypothetical protein
MYEDGAKVLHGEISFWLNSGPSPSCGGGERTPRPIMPSKLAAFGCRERKPLLPGGRLYRNTLLCQETPPI